MKKVKSKKKKVFNYAWTVPIFEKEKKSWKHDDDSANYNQLAKKEKKKPRE